jgi:hypothetical protein
MQMEDDDFLNGQIWNYPFYTGFLYKYMTKDDLHVLMLILSYVAISLHSSS